MKPCVTTTLPLLPSRSASDGSCELSQVADRKFCAKLRRGLSSLFMNSRASTHSVGMPMDSSQAAPRVVAISSPSASVRALTRGLASRMRRTPAAVCSSMSKYGASSAAPSMRMSSASAR